MYTVDHAAQVQVVTSGHTPEGVSRPTITTMLFELITVLQDIVGPEGDALVVRVVDDLQRSERLTFSTQT